jgi:hypothetical protein
MKSTNNILVVERHVERPLGRQMQMDHIEIFCESGDQIINYGDNSKSK